MERENNTLSEDIKGFISEQTGISAKRISKNSRLEKDLKIYGDDAFELIKAYSKRFDVDVSEFNIANYFSPEGGTFLYRLINPAKNSLTVSDLENGVIKGKLR